MAKTHKAQHFVPRTYLASWCDKETPHNQTPYVWTFPSLGGAGRRKAPSNLFTETDMYTVSTPDGGRDLRIEHGLQQIEQGLQSLLADYISRRRQIPTARFMRLVTFIAAMKGRTVAFRDHQRSQWQRVLDLGKDVEASVSKLSHEERMAVGRRSMPQSSTRPSMTLADVQKLADMPVQLMLPAVIDSQVPFLSQMEMTIYCTGSSPGFVTSDNPVAWFDPEAADRPFMFAAPALMHRTTEVTMPLSPQHLVVIRHADPPTRGIKPILYVDAWDITVRNMNRRTVWHASKTIVSCADGYREEWCPPSFREAVAAAESEQAP